MVLANDQLADLYEVFGDCTTYADRVVGAPIDTVDSLLKLCLCCQSLSVLNYLG